MYFSPLPKFNDFFSALKKNNVSNNDILKLWSRDGELANWLSRSAWSLLLIFLWRKKIYGDIKKINIWIPDFFCNSSLELLRKSDANLTFYPVDLNMAPDYAALKDMTSTIQPDIFILVHFFGKPFDSARAKQFCSSSGSWLIEDAVHALVPSSSIGKFGDFVIYSPHKLFSIPNGSILNIRKKGPGKIDFVSKDFMYDKNKWLKLLQNFILEKNIKLTNTHFFLIKWFLKKILQKLGFKRKISLKYEEVQENVNQQFFINPKISSVSLSILKNNLANIPKISLARLKNNQIWDYFIRDYFKLNQNSLLIDQCDLNYTPYLSVFKFNKKTAPKIFNNLHEKNLCVSSWPDLPPEVKENKDFHKNAWELRHSHIYLPCHQTINTQSFFNLFKTIDFTETSINKIYQENNKISREEWHAFLASSENSNLLQSWTYGNAKSDIEGWILKRLVFKQDSKILAIVNLLEKRIFGIKFLRVNRGPLFSNEVNNSQKEIILKMLLNLGDFKKMSILFFAPELSLNGKNLSYLISNNLKFYNIKTWSSSRINLSFEMDQLKSNFNSTWRYNLSNSNKYSLSIECGTNSKLVDWVIDKYSLNMKEKKFSGITIPLFESIHKNMNKDCALLFFRVIENDTPVSGSCFAFHGNSATYLIGWTGERGRELSANHFQLWNVIKELKKRNIKWLDLGGIDKEESPGISEFKLGMKGDYYSLVGDGVKWF